MHPILSARGGDGGEGGRSSGTVVEHVVEVSDKLHQTPNLPPIRTLLQARGGGGGGGGEGGGTVVERVVEVEGDVDAIREQMRIELEQKMKAVSALGSRLLAGSRH